jgi:5-formyltetrahydrofolate cyclo-ligase
MQRRRRHDADAGGAADLRAAKAALREQVWSAMTAARVARFPGAEGRIPNFAGAERAAELLRGTPEWRQARTVKANPDAAQWPVRQRALEDRKRLYMAVPRLAEPDPFFLLDPDRLADSPRAASSIKGASRSARRVRLDALEPVDLVVSGCVAAGLDGARLGKGGGFADLEFALAGEAGLVGEHDVLLDLIVTPERVIDCRAGRRARPRPAIRWAELTEDKIAAIPLLAALRAAGRPG